MKLLEYEGKAILKAGGIAVPKSFTAEKLQEFLPVVLKSQVPVGGRGRAGGIIIVKNAIEYKAARKMIKNLSIDNYKPHIILAEEFLAIDKELYLSLLINKSTATIELMAHERGGVEVEENPASEFLTLSLTPNTIKAIGKKLADYYNLLGKTVLLQDLVEKLYRLFVSEDMTLCEINPLILTKTGELVAGDAKIVLDDAASFRHPDWSFEEEKAETNFVTLTPRGNVATIANGAGLAMATVDAVADAGLKSANFLDIGGGASETSVLVAFERIMNYPNVRVIIINIFAGITRCDEVAKAIVAARKQLPNLPPLAIRLVGTNYDQAAKLLEAERIELHASLEDAITTAKASV